MACMYTHTHTRTHAHTHTCIYAHMHLRTCTGSTHTCICIRVHSCVLECVHIWAHVHSYACLLSLSSSNGQGCCSSRGSLGRGGPHLTLCGPRRPPEILRTRRTGRASAHSDRRARKTGRTASGEIARPAPPVQDYTCSLSNVFR
jgi:hypothetical protein